MAEAQSSGADCVLTIGGVQSNHARATASAAAQLGLACHLILRTSRAAVEGDPGLTGNLMVERMVGATCWMARLLLRCRSKLSAAVASRRHRRLPPQLSTLFKPSPPAPPFQPLSTAQPPFPPAPLPPSPTPPKPPAGRLPRRSTPASAPPRC